VGVRKELHLAFRGIRLAKESTPKQHTFPINPEFPIEVIKASKVFLRIFNVLHQELNLQRPVLWRKSTLISRSSHVISAQIPS
jgi:hypothetical protein